jgi:hypothetical protein
VPYRIWFIDRLVKDLKARTNSQDDQVSHDKVEGMKSYQAMIDKKFGLE